MMGISNPLEYTQNIIYKYLFKFLFCELYSWWSYLIHVLTKREPTKMMQITPIRKQNYFEGVGCDRNICTHSLWKWTFYFVLYVWYFMDLPNFPSNISFGYYHCRTCILRTLFPQCYGNLCKSNVKIFCAETFSTSQNKFWKMKSYTFDGFGN